MIKNEFTAFKIGSKIPVVTPGFTPPNYPPCVSARFFFVNKVGGVIGRAACKIARPSSRRCVSDLPYTPTPKSRSPCTSYHQQIVQRFRSWFPVVNMLDELEAVVKNPSTLDL
jgi:hypothetical protein